jgi:lysophospholipase L1-like esterase
MVETRRPMKEQAQTGFWNSVGMTSGALAALSLIALSAGPLAHSPAGLAVAKAIELLRSRVVITNPGVIGYYEQLFGATGHAMFMSEAEFKRFSKGPLNRLFVSRTRHGSPEFIYDGILMYRYKPNLKGYRGPSEPQGVTTNSFGFLGPEYSLEKPPGTRRVILLGDSLTVGWGNPQNSSYPRQLENVLNTQTNQHFEILNFSVPGYLLTQMLPLAEQSGPRFHPDVYMLALTELAVSRTWSEHLIRLIQSGIDPRYPFLKEAAREAGISPEDDPLTSMDKLAPLRLKVLREIFAEMQAFAARQHAAFIVALVPSLEDGDMSRHRLGGMREILQSLNIPVADILDTFSGVADQNPLRINTADVHPNTAGHAMLAESLYSKLREHPEFWGGPSAHADR